MRCDLSPIRAATSESLAPLRFHLAAYETLSPLQGGIGPDQFLALLVALLTWVCISFSDGHSEPSSWTSTHRPAGTFTSARKSRGSCMTGRTTDTLFLRADGLARRSLQVVLELEVAAFPRLDFVITIIHAEVNSCYHKKETRAAEDDRHGHADRPPLTGRAPGSLR
jgi:hypothetical protein